MLFLVTRDGTNDGILLSAQAIYRALCIPLSLSCLVLGLALGVLLFPSLLPGGGTGQIAGTLNEASLDGMILARSFAATDASESDMTKVEYNAALLTSARYCWWKTWYNRVSEYEDEE